MYKIYQLLDAIHLTGADNSQWITVDFSAKYDDPDFDEDEALAAEFGDGEIADGVIIRARYMAVWRDTDLFEHLASHTLLFPSCAYRLKDGEAVLLYHI